MSQRKIRQRPPSRKRTLPNTIGIAWYREEQWARLREISSDLDVLEETHGEWLHAAEKTFANLTDMGVPARKVDVDVESLYSWCKKENRAVNGESRSSFVAHTLRLQDSR